MSVDQQTQEAPVSLTDKIGAAWDNSPERAAPQPKAETPAPEPQAEAAPSAAPAAQPEPVTPQPPAWDQRFTLKGKREIALDLSKETDRMRLHGMAARGLAVEEESRRLADERHALSREREIFETMRKGFQQPQQPESFAWDQGAAPNPAELVQREAQRLREEMQQQIANVQRQYEVDRATQRIGSEMAVLRKQYEWLTPTEENVLFLMGVEAGNSMKGLPNAQIPTLAELAAERDQQYKAYESRLTAKFQAQQPKPTPPPVAPPAVVTNKDRGTATAPKPKQQTKDDIIGAAFERTRKAS